MLINGKQEHHVGDSSPAEAGSDLPGVTQIIINIFQDKSYITKRKCHPLSPC
jgi:hypothetical protein